MPEPIAVKKKVPKEVVPASQGSLEKIIKNYMAIEDIAPSRFGRDVMGDPNFISRWTRDRTQWNPKTRVRLTKFFLEAGYLQNG